jgi:hypothetical protein
MQSKALLVNLIQVVFTFKKGQIPVGQHTVCVQDLDRSITPPPNKDVKLDSIALKRGQQ